MRALVIMAALVLSSSGCFGFGRVAKPEPKLATAGVMTLPVSFKGIGPLDSDLWVCGWLPTRTDPAAAFSCVDYEYFMTRLEEPKDP